MATLVSPGVSVTVTDESFFIPAAASTVPLLFVATAAEKKQPDGITDAAGTFEHDVIRTVTSLKQSTELYGVPRFLKDVNGSQLHGDSRNEYGLFALNEFLGIGNLAYVLRANINLDDTLVDLRAVWDSKMLEAASVLQNLAQSFIDQYNTSNGYIPTSGQGIATFSTLVPGTGYTSGTYANVPFTGGTGNGATATIVVSEKGIVTFGAITPGSLYIPGVYTNVPLTGGAGTGATANITVGPLGTVTVVTLVARGNSYNVGNALSASNTNLGGAGSGFSIPVATVNGDGVLTLSGITPGTLYTPGTYLSVPLTGGTGLGVLATVTVGGGGGVSSVVITTPGAGYTALDVLSANAVDIGGTGSGFSVPVNTVTGGGVTDVTLGLTGTGYTALDVLSALNTNLGGTGSGFSIVAATVTGSLFKTTVTQIELLSLANTATLTVWEFSSFTSSQHPFMDDHTLSPMDVFSGVNGYNSPAVPPQFIGFAGMVLAGPLTYLPSAAAALLLSAATPFKFTLAFLNGTSLGANDAARRAAIVTALQATVNSNTDIRGETFEYNLILCPGYSELADELLNLCIDIQEEAMVIADTPMNMNPDDVVVWAATPGRVTSRNVTYYYPHGLASNLDGNNVFIAASGIALRTIAFSDEVSELWFAPAGTRRGLVSGVSMVGYVTGTLGTATTFNEVSLNQGQRDNLYKYFTNINPIVFFPGRGLIVWGQKTSAPDASALDRINVVRLVMYVKRQLRKNTMSFVFEPNDQLTRDNLKAMVDGFLGDLIIKRGLFDFATVCDDSNNTPDRIDRNEMYIDVALKPVKAAEFIFIPIRIVATGASI